MLDDARIKYFGKGGFSKFSQFGEGIKAVMSAECSSNVLSLFCRSQFRECGQVEDTSYEEAMWVPSLMCRSECERHYGIWNQCVADLEKDPVNKAAFNDMMQKLVAIVFLVEDRTFYNNIFYSNSDVAGGWRGSTSYGTFGARRYIAV
jgi:hypothetical protein